MLRCRSHMSDLLLFLSLQCRWSVALPDRPSHTQHCLRGQRAELSCTFPAELPHGDPAVVWKVESSGSSRRVYVFDGQEVLVSFEGFAVDLGRLRLGDASLQLANSSVADEGQYTCTVMITPHMYTSSVILQVSAQPRVELPAEVRVTQGAEKTLLCNISQFYPREISVSWLVQDQQGETEALSHDVCTGVPVRDGRGSFSVHSRVTVRDGAVYICQVEHRAFGEPRRWQAKVTVRAPVSPYNIKTLISSSIGCSLFVVFLILGGVFIYTKYFRTVSPSVSEILKPSMIYSRTPLELKCHVTKRCHRTVKICWMRLPSDSSSPGEMETAPLSNWQDVSDQAQVEADKMNLVSTLIIQPTIREDGSKYQCAVLYSRKHKPIRRITSLNIRAYPSAQEVSSSPPVPTVGTELLLCCRVERFYPKPIRLQWFRQDGESLGEATQFGPISDHEQLYSVWSQVQFTVANHHIGSVFICRVFHDSFLEPGYKDVTYHINPKGVPPNVMFIRCDPLCPRAGDECTFNCCISDFYPEGISVTWLKNGSPLQEGVFTFPPALSSGGQFSSWSFLKLKATQEDHLALFTCVVEHSAQTEREERQHVLSLTS